MKMSKLLLVLLISLQAGSCLAYELAPPPEKGSAVDREDFRILHVYQNERTREQCEAADAQSIPTVEGMFGPNTGVLTAAEIKKVRLRSVQIIAKVFNIITPFKKQYHRMRPYNADPTLHPCVAIPGGNMAYPSGHSAAGIALSVFLAKEFPAKRDQILQQGKQVGINRLIGGVHHPSDVAAGQALGKQIASDLSAL